MHVQCMCPVVLLGLKAIALVQTVIPRRCFMQRKPELLRFQPLFLSFPRTSMVNKFSRLLPHMKNRFLVHIQQPACLLNPCTPEMIRQEICYFPCFGLKINLHCFHHFTAEIHRFPVKNYAGSPSQPGHSPP